MCVIAEYSSVCMISSPKHGIDVAYFFMIQFDKMTCRHCHWHRREGEEKEKFRNKMRTNDELNCAPISTISTKFSFTFRKIKFTQFVFWGTPTPSLFTVAQWQRACACAPNCAVDLRGKCIRFLRVCCKWVATFALWMCVRGIATVAATIVARHHSGLARVI